MKLSKYINDLLYRYDCVIIPNFGGFVTNKIGARVDEETHQFFPPTKLISFNSYLKHNDGLLINHIASCENITFDEANILISNIITECNEQLLSSSVVIDEVGTLYLTDDKQLSFEPFQNSNFSIDSFGLSAAQSNPIFRFTLDDRYQLSKNQDSDNYEIKESETNTILTSTELPSKKSVIPMYIKYVAAVAILLTLGVAGYNNYNTNLESNLLVKQQDQLKNKIQTATFFIEQPLPAVEVNIVSTKKKKEIDADVKPAATAIIEKNYHIIAAAFRDEKNALLKVKELKAKGYASSLVCKNKWGLYLVSYNSYANNRTATNFLNSVKRNLNQEAWLLYLIK